MASLDIEWKHLTIALNDFADYFIQLAKDNLQANGSIASSTLYDSFEKIIEIGDDYYSVKISLEDYWVYVENGRSAGRFPPIDKIRNWIEIKPIEALPDANGRTPSVDQLSFLISRKIAQEGIEPKPFFEPARQEAINRFELTIDLAIQEDVDEFIKEKVNDYLIEKFREIL